ncbi:SET domain-containing protein [Panus rudis PR-1116 ss-1]|nr:SET domain-containing protein [Panus rudis PR-1116 ss-1]
MAASVAVHEYPESTNTRSRPSSTRFNSNSSINDIEETNEESFTLSDIPNKGKGLVAARPIQRGELLFAEAPLLSLPPSPPNSTIMAALSRCTREEQCQYFALSNAFKGRVLPARGIFDTNSILYHVGDRTEGGDVVREVAGIFLLASFFNSSCSPNVSRYWDQTQGMMHFRTLRDIEEGEELCINYCEILATREERKNEIMRDKGFECRCSACEVEEEDKVRESDDRRVTIAALYDEVGECANEPMLAIRKVKRALRLLKEEGIVTYVTSFCYDAFQFCVMVSDFSTAKQWIRQAYEVSLCTTGPDSDAARMFKMYWANPRAHPMAGAFQKSILSGPDMGNRTSVKLGG